ncbi:docking protein 2 isoform X1 [Xyrichtys novacula]|uniref:Docking protein 2 isoform X1 n=1 Tax=Xyrichtys novacula TaxID=13765 RepID=A0AAV1GA64_XYRNO|nr:docking protein 2 isoform X1 [Xyrichtys novacula]
MEEDIRKQGMLYLQQQRFGKKWKRVWCVLYRESPCSISRLEFFECKDGGSVEKNDRNLRKQQEHKKVIRLADCIRVSEVMMDGCPRDTGPFLIETTEKKYVFASDRQHLDDWTQKLCEIAFPMSWTEQSVKRGSLHRGNRVDEDEGMEDNSLYSSRQTMRDFRVCVRRTEASERCRMRGDGVLRADIDALLLLNKSEDVVYRWPYRFLRRFGRDKSTFSFEAGRRCDSGEGSFEFDTKQGNLLFQAVEAAIDLQRLPLPHRQPSGGGQASPETPQDLSLPPLPLNSTLFQSRTPPLPQPRCHVPQAPAAQAADGVYSMVTEPSNLQMSHHKDKESANSSPQSQHRPPLTRLEPPVDKTLTGVKSLTLETRALPIPRKNQVKMISSCPLPNAGPESDTNPPSSSSSIPSSSKLGSNLDKTYSKITLPPERATKREKRSGSLAQPCTTPQITPEPEYSLPFDTIAVKVMSNILNSHQALGAEGGADPLYDSIDEMKIRNIFSSDADTLGPPYAKVEHIYDEPEGCAAPTAQKPPTSVYDEPEEMRGDAWRIMGTPADPKGHEYPYNPRVDDYAVPKRPQRACPVSQSTTEEEDKEEEPQREEEEEEEEGVVEEQQDSPYNNVNVKMA